MGVSFKILYSEWIRKDLKKIDPKDQQIIRKILEAKVFQNPKQFSKPLQHTLYPLRSARIGNFRVVFEAKEKTVFVLGIAHRKDIYQIMRKRKGQRNQE